MHAEIIAVGTEMLGPARLDTNSLFLARELIALGVSLNRKQIVPDDRAVLAVALAEAYRRSPLVIATGGLGPTTDDVTEAAAAVAVGETYAAAQRLPNRRGSASGVWCATESGILILLPGPPHELEAMFVAEVRPRLAALLPPVARFTRVLSMAGLPEEAVERVAAPIYRRVSNPVTTILATSDPQVELHFHAWARTPAAARRRADAVARSIAVKLGDAVFSREGESLAAVVGEILCRRGQTLAVAESCTGGLLGARITADPGASNFFIGGVISYSNEVKQSLLGVRAATLARFGAVSMPTAREMARGVRTRLAADWGLSITGIAGPNGATAAKPIGTVYIGWASPDGRAGSQHFAFPALSTRDRIRARSAQAALNLLRLALQ